MSAAVMTIQRRTWNGARVGARRPRDRRRRPCVALLIITNNDSVGFDPDRRADASSSTPGSDIACGVGHPC